MGRRKEDMRPGKKGRKERKKWQDGVIAEALERVK